jgi:hypothetical protein
MADAPVDPSLAHATEHAQRSLLDALASVEDPRNPSGRRHSIGALLGLLMAGFLSGATTVKGAVALGRHRRALRAQLGFTHEKCPSQSTYTRLFKALPVEALRAALEQWLHELVGQWCERRRRGAAVAVDGKALRGAGQHTLNVFVHELWVLLDSHRLDAKENEMSAFRARLEEFCARHAFVRILTFDAAFCERHTMEALSRHNRLGLFAVKDNQPEATRRLERWFASVINRPPDHREVEKKRGLHRHARAVGGRRPARHR